MPDVSPTEFVHRFAGAMEASDMATIAHSFAPDVRAYITNALGGTDLVEGSAALPSAEGGRCTTSPVSSSACPPRGA